MAARGRSLTLSALILLTACPGGGGSAPPVAEEAELVLNGSVDAIAVATDGTAYVGGDFTAVGPFTGHVVVLDPATGALAAPPPRIGGASRWTGRVSAAAADGRGGWYVGGGFLTLGSEASPLALFRMRADGTLDPAFVTALDGDVSTLAVGDGVVYVGGTFEHVGGAARHRLAAVDATTGAVTAWDPTLPSSLAVSALAVGNGVVYAAGGPDIGAAGSSWIVAIDPAGIVSAWRPSLDGSGVNTLALRGRTLFAGGSFKTIDGQARRGLAAFDPDGALSAWDGGTWATVGALAVADDGSLYAGGWYRDFHKGGWSDPSPALVAFDPSGALSTWNPGLDGPVWSLAASGRTLYVGGTFAKAGTTRRMNAAAFDASGALLPWDPRANGAAVALAVSGGRVLAGGDLWSVGGVSRRGLAAFDAQGRLTAWAPEVDVPRWSAPDVRALALVGDRLYVGGSFDQIAGVPRAGLAAIDREGNVLGGTPAVRGTVFALAELGGAIYVGGRLSQVGNVPRLGLASFDPAAGGSVLPFDPSLASTYPDGPTVYALASTGSTLYAGGVFSMGGGAPRGNGAAFDAAGALLPWDPAASGPSRGAFVSDPAFSPAISALATSDRGVYVGGRFTSLGGRVRRSAGLVDARTGAALDWEAAIDSELPLTDLTDVRAILPRGDKVYLGGVFWRIGGAPRACAAAVDAATGAAASWNPGNAGVEALAPRGDRILIGGLNGLTSVAP